jgi:hypothetical protein
VQKRVKMSHGTRETSFKGDVFTWDWSKDVPK